MHAHTRAQLAAATSPPAISASPSAHTSPTVAPAKVTTPNSIPAAAPPQASDSPVASKPTTIVKEPTSKNSDSSSSGSGYSGEAEGESAKKSPGEFDAGKLYIPVKVRSGTAGGDTGRRKSEDGFSSAIVFAGRECRPGDGMGVIAEGGVHGEEEVGAAGEEKRRRGSGDSTTHATTRLRCDCDDCEGCRVRKGLLARNGLCMTDVGLGRRETV